jgi:hypothetical protein
VVAEPKPQQFMAVMKKVIMVVVVLVVIMDVKHTVQYNSNVSKG